MVTAINIETGVWNKIIDTLMAKGWKPIYKYNGFDAAIDYDLLVLAKNGEEILFGWDNWNEGEIQCSETRVRQLCRQLKLELKTGEPSSLKASVVSLYYTRGKRAPSD